jgi:hypothetical protein
VSVALFYDLDPELFPAQAPPRAARGVPARAELKPRLGARLSNNKAKRRASGFGGR